MQAVTIWDGLKAPVELTVFQKLAFGSRDSLCDELDVEAAAGEDRLCKAAGTEFVACDKLAGVSVVADEPAAWLTAAACSVCP